VTWFIKKLRQHKFRCLFISTLDSTSHLLGRNYQIITYQHTDRQTDRHPFNGLFSKTT